MPFFILVISIVFLCGGCTQQQVQRAAFETLQNIKSQECDDRLVDGCQEGENFDTYQRQRRQVVVDDR